MGTRLQKKYTSTNLSAESVLTNWIKATSDLYINYRKIMTAVNRPETESLRQEKQYIGQCPRVLLMELAITMQQELERLLLDMEKIDTFTPSTSKQTIKRLFDHTNALNELNDQAQIRLDLVTHSPS
ncbi:hypothetical protein GO730_04275 [Spirosoma sp. HMF3257]|uniref:Uncharacterized protein n=1 Tax=Spirosoma telluris TaxID=2183553 RepID=A0A327NER4_9BACT|nr:hypothetical protein [Spirosoma telluris]RAI73810.1 hypothetical protein HMF3257_04245 [Spirosoma telluris]